MCNDELAEDVLEDVSALRPLRLAITALSRASTAEVWNAVRDAVRVYAREPTATNAVKVEATLLALQLKMQRRGIATSGRRGADRPVPRLNGRRFEADPGWRPG